MAAEASSVSKIGNNVIQTGVHRFTNNQIEYNGVLFDCRQCNKNRGECCNVFDENDPNRLPCMKCVCQSAYDTMDDSREEPVNMAQCQNCRDVALSFCSRENHLVNRLVQDIKIFDCSQNILVDGTANTLEQIEMKNQCVSAEGSAAPTIVLPTATEPTDGSYTANFFARIREEGYTLHHFVFAMAVAVCASLLLLSTSALIDSAAIWFTLVVAYIALAVAIYLAAA